jgi:hypothetical protein
MLAASWTVVKTYQSTKDLFPLGCCDHSYTHTHTHTHTYNMLPASLTLSGFLYDLITCCWKPNGYPPTTRTTGHVINRLLVTYIVFSFLCWEGESWVGGTYIGTSHLCLYVSIWFCTSSSCDHESQLPTTACVLLATFNSVF